MRILAFQSPRFAWKPASQTLPDAAPASAAEVADCLVAFLHIEADDEEEAARKRAFKHTLKHLKWLANKRELRNVVLHSFAHLGGDNSTPAFARAFLDELAERLQNTGYTVQQTPFGWFCSWELAVHGDSLAKVWKRI